MSLHYNHQIHGVLQQIDELFEGFWDWLELQYDPITGGFYYARSSRESSLFTPDIESTAQALNILERCSLLQAVDEPMRQGLIHFFQSKQMQHSGYFYDEHPNMREDEVMVGRALQYSVSALRKLGADPIFPLPLAHHGLPSYMETPRAYREWLERVNMRNSWRACDRIAVTAAYLSQLENQARDPYLSTAFEYLGEIQNEATGLWGEGTRYVQLSGTFKLHLYYDRFNRPLPMEEIIYESIKRTVEEDEAVDMCYIRNPLHLLSYMNVNKNDRELLSLMTAAYSNMRRLLRSDGGFSRELHRSPPAPNVAQFKEEEHAPDLPLPVCIGEGKVEGDMNAGTQAVLIRSLLYKLAGAAESPLQPSRQLFSYRKNQ